MNEPSTEGRRVIGPLGAISIVAGSMLGIGIFLNPRIVAEQLPSPGLFLLAWIVGGMIALAGSVAYAELGTMFPKAGGDYVFLREAFGSSTAFASGWLLFAAVFTGSIATMAVPVVQYQMPVIVGPWFPSLDLSQEVLGPITAVQLWAIAIVVLLTLVNMLGTRLAAWAQIAFTMVPFGILALGAVWALITAPHESAVASTTAVPEGEMPMRFMRATLAIYFAYAGWNAVGYVGGEVKRPGRNIPIGLLGGTTLITAFYFLLCVAFLAVLGMGGLPTAFEAGSATAGALGGEDLAYFFTWTIAFALFGSLNGTVLAGARIGFAMAKDGALPSSLAVLHPTWKTPVRALWLQALLSCVLILSGTFEALVEMTSIAMFLMGSLTVVSLFVLRQQRPELTRPYRATGYPVLPAFYLLVCVAVMLASLIRAFGESEPGDVPPWYPLVGVVVFVVAWVGHRLMARTD